LVAVLVAVLEEVGLPPFPADLTGGLSFDIVIYLAPSYVKRDQRATLMPRLRLLCSEISDGP
jgi:hypothetical protein